MPRFAILAATSKSHLCVDASLLEERDAIAGETGAQRDVEASVAIEVDGVLAIALQSLLIGQEHGNARAVLALEEHLLGGVVAHAECHLWGIV